MKWVGDDYRGGTLLDFSITYFGDGALTVFGHMPVCVRRLTLKAPAELTTKAGNLKKANLYPSWL